MLYLRGFFEKNQIFFIFGPDLVGFLCTVSMPCLNIPIAHFLLLLGYQENVPV